MMTKNLLIFLGLILSTCSFSQKQDTHWYFGDSAGLDFSMGSPIPVQNSSMLSFEVSTSISDSSGNLIAYSDGGTIWNRNHQIMPNGTGLIAGPISPGIGNSCSNGTLLLPTPGNQNQLYLISIYTAGVSNWGLFYSIIDLNLDGTLGDITSDKNILLLNDSLDEKLAAVRHANGRDWWVVAHISRVNGSKSFFKFLLTPSGITSYGIQDIGSVYGSFWGLSGVGEISFSNSGGSLVSVNHNGIIDLFNFDRCSGTLSNHVEIGTPPYNSITYHYGCSFSASDNNLFISTNRILFCYRLDTSDIKASRRKIWEIPDTFFFIGQHQLGPDNKIYISVGTSNHPNDTICPEVHNLCVINNPDSSLANLDFQPFSFSIAPARTIYSLPNMPNYRLGALAGSPCDTILSVRQKSENNKTEIYPNPGKDFVNVRTDYRGKQELTLFDSNGREVLHSTLGKGDNRIETASLSPGIYYFLFSGNDGEYTSRKWVKTE